MLISYIPSAVVGLVTMQTQFQRARWPALLYFPHGWTALAKFFPFVFHPSPWALSPASSLT